MRKQVRVKSQLTSVWATSFGSYRSKHHLMKSGMVYCWGKSNLLEMNQKCSTMQWIIFAESQGHILLCHYVQLSHRTVYVNTIEWKEFPTNLRECVLYILFKFREIFVEIFFLVSQIFTKFPFELNVCGLNITTHSRTTNSFFFYIIWSQNTFSFDKM